MKTLKLFVAFLILGLGVCNTPLRGQESAAPDPQLKTLLQQQKEDRQQIEQLKQRLDATDKKLGATQQAADAQKAAPAAGAGIQPVIPVPVAGEDTSAVTRNLTIAGYIDARYEKAEGQDGTFRFGHFNPIFLFRASDNVLAEAEVEIEVDKDGETEVMLEYAQIDYLVNDYLTLIAGRFLLPLGIWKEKLHPSWISKSPTKPLPYASKLLPGSDIGVQARGALHLSDPLQLTYAAYVVNGPGDDSATNITFDVGADFNDRPSGGGRVAIFFPWAAYHGIEVGVSGQKGTWSSDGDRQWSAAVADASVLLGEHAELRGEYMKTWQQTDTEGTLDKKGWWAQAAYKLAGLNLDLPIVNDLECVFRYSGLQLPEGNANQYSPGLNYYINNTFIVKAAADIGQSDTESLDKTKFTFQVAYGF